MYYLFHFIGSERLRKIKSIPKITPLMKVESACKCNSNNKSHTFFSIMLVTKTVEVCEQGMGIFIVLVLCSKLILKEKKTNKI